MKRIETTVIALVCAMAALQQSQAITVDEMGTGPGEVLTVNVSGSGTLLVDAGLLNLEVGGLHVDGFCIDPFHFSDGLMTGYQVVGLTSAPKQNLMSSATALLIERLWGSYYSPGMSSSDAAGLQIAFWELTGGSGFKLLSGNDYGAAGFLAAVQAPNYDGPVADLVALTGPGQDYAVEAAAVNSLTVPEATSTLMLFAFALLTLWIVSWRSPRFALARV